MKKIIVIIGMVLLFSTNCLAQAKTFATAIEERQKITLSLKEEQLRLQKHDADSFFSESNVMCKSLKDLILEMLTEDGYKARLGFILSESTCRDGILTIKSENQDIFSVTNPRGSSYIAIVEREGSEVSIKMFCDLFEDWQKTFKEVYGSPEN